MWVLLLIAFLMTGEGEPMGRVVVFRDNGFMAKGSDPSVFVNGEEVARMDRGRYFVISLPHGKHDFAFLSLDSAYPPKQVVVSNETVFLEASFSFKKAKGFELKAVSQAEAEKKIRKLKPLSKEMVKDKRVSVQPWR